MILQYGAGTQSEDGRIFRDKQLENVKDKGLGGSGRTSRECCEGAEKF